MAALTFPVGIPVTLCSGFSDAVPTTRAARLQRLRARMLIGLFQIFKRATKNYLWHSATAQIVSETSLMSIKLGATRASSAQEELERLSRNNKWTVKQAQASLQQRGAIENAKDEKSWQLRFIITVAGISCLSAVKNKLWIGETVYSCRLGLSHGQRHHLFPASNLFKVVNTGFHRAGTLYVPGKMPLGSGSAPTTVSAPSRNGALAHPRSSIAKI